MKTKKPSLISQNCYNLLKKIPKGKVTTYGDLAKALHSKGARAIGQIVGRNPDAPQVPCHRVVRSDGSIGGYAFGTPKKIKLLSAEGISIQNGKVKDFEKVHFRFR